MSEEFLRDIVSAIEEVEKKRTDKRRDEEREKRQINKMITTHILNIEDKEHEDKYALEESMLEKRRMEIIKSIRDLLEELERINNRIRELRTRELLSSGGAIDIEQA